MLLGSARSVPRFALNTSTQVADEWAGYLLASTCCLGLGYTVLEDGFVKVELLLRGAGPRWQRAAAVLGLTAAGVVGLILTSWLGVQAEQSYRMGLRSISVSRTPLWLPQGLMLSGVAGFVLQVVAELLRAGSRRPPAGNGG